MTVLAAPRMIFVVGARRSGTRWVERILGSTQDAVTIPCETHLFQHALAPLFESAQHAVPSSPQVGSFFVDRSTLVSHTRGLCDAIYDGYRARLNPHATTVIDRSPWNVFALDRIAEVYPEAIVVHVIRDGRDVVRSLLAQDWGPDDATQAAEEWVNAVRAGRAQSRFDGYVEVRYEQLFAEPAEQIAALLKRVGLPNEDEAVDRAVSVAGEVANLDPTNPSVALSKWQTMPPEMLQATYNAAGPTLRELGYAVGPVLPSDSQPPLDATRIVARVKRAVTSLAPSRPSAPNPDAAFALVGLLSALQAGTSPADFVIRNVEVVTSGLGPRTDASGPRAIELLRSVVQSEGSVQNATIDASSGHSIVTQHVVGVQNEAVLVHVATLRGGRVARVTVHRVPALPFPAPAAG